MPRDGETPPPNTPYGGLVLSCAWRDGTRSHSFNLRIPNCLEESREQCLRIYGKVHAGSEKCRIEYSSALVAARNLAAFPFSSMLFGPVVVMWLWKRQSSSKLAPLGGKHPFTIETRPCRRSMYYCICRHELLMSEQHPRIITRGAAQLPDSSFRFVAPPPLPAAETSPGADDLACLCALGSLLLTCVNWPRGSLRLLSHLGGSRHTHTRIFFVQVHQSAHKLRVHVRSTDYFLALCKFANT